MASASAGAQSWPTSSLTRRSHSRSPTFDGSGRTDVRGYWLAAIGSTFIPWNVATLAGVLLGAQIPDPAVVGIDIIFPAAMIGLTVGLITGRRELVAAVVGAGIAVVVALVSSPSIGIVAGGVLGPLAGLAMPAGSGAETARLGTAESAERYSMPGARPRADTAESTTRSDASPIADSPPPTEPPHP